MLAKTRRRLSRESEMKGTQQVVTFIANNAGDLCLHVLPSHMSNDYFIYSVLLFCSVELCIST